jgi:3-oxoacyl-[acyl-carrier protein] reductase/pteridine reductase
MTYHTSRNDADETAAHLIKFGVRAFALQCDLRDAVAIPDTVQRAVAELGGLDLLVNNAGSYQTRTFEAISIQDWDEVFAVNVRAAHFMTQASSDELRRRKGRIVNIGSLGGIQPWATHAHYCASKAALHMLTQASAKALAPDITVNCVAPGMIDQGEPEGAEILSRFADKTPMQRNGSASDVAQAVLFFATCPQFITGQILTVDGGLSLT